MQYLAEPTSATLFMDVGVHYCALQQNLDKATKDKNQNFLDNVFVWSSRFVFWFYSFNSSFCDLRIVWKEFRFKNLKSDVVRIQYPRSKIVKKRVLDPG